MSGGVHFHGNVTAGTMNTAAQGDINNNHGHHQHVTGGVDPRRVAALVRALRDELDAAPLDRRTRDAAHDALDEVDRDVASGEPRGLADRVRSVRDVITGAGGVVTAGGTLWSALEALAAAVGLGL
ncbi:hypothetical protein [Umezawaea sp.]|uniref:hypothetical protein n=1 Tax=Umezawaea sp. TaxID=1955258 RepID=UPI002ED5BF1E